jgi:hypothetical protein
MKKISLVLASLLIASSSAYALTPEERKAIACDSHILRPVHNELRQEIRGDRMEMRGDRNMVEGNHKMCKKCKHKRHHYKHHSKKAAKAAAKTEAKSK